MSASPIKAPTSKARNAAKAAYMLACRKDRGHTPEQVTAAHQNLWYEQVRDVVTFAITQEPGLRPEQRIELARLLEDELSVSL